MDWLINLYAKSTKLWALSVDLLPMLGGVGGLLGVGASILARASQAQTPADLLHALTPTAQEAATASLSAGLIKAHLNHLQNAAAIAQNGSKLPQDGGSAPQQAPGA